MFFYCFHASSPTTDADECNPKEEHTEGRNTFGGGVAESWLVIDPVCDRMDTTPHETVPITDRS